MKKNGCMFLGEPLFCKSWLQDTQLDYKHNDHILTPTIRAVEYVIFQWTLVLSETADDCVCKH